MVFNILKWKAFRFGQHQIRKNQPKTTDNGIKKRRSGQWQSGFNIVIRFLWDESKHVVDCGCNSSCHATRSAKFTPKNQKNLFFLNFQSFFWLTWRRRVRIGTSMACQRSRKRWRSSTTRDKPAEYRWDLDFPCEIFRAFDWMTRSRWANTWIHKWWVSTSIEIHPTAWSSTADACP